MVRCEDLNITFFHATKNAGSSIEVWLEDNVDGDVYDGDLRHAAPKDLDSLFDDFGWSFCCIRNPWDRVVSWYLYFKRHKFLDCNFGEYLKQACDPNLYGLKYARFPEHQMFFITRVDYCIKYENLIEDFKVVQKKVNCFEPLGIMNTSRNKKDKYLDYYTKDEYINMVGDYFKIDLDVTNYSFGD